MAARAALSRDPAGATSKLERWGASPSLDPLVQPEGDGGGGGPSSRFSAPCPPRRSAPQPARAPPPVPLAWKLLSITRAPIFSPSRNLESVFLYTKTSEKALTFSYTKLYLPNWMILEYIPVSHIEKATCKYRREDTMRVGSHRCTRFGSLGDSGKPDEEQWWSPGNPARSEHTHSGWKARPLPGGWNFQVHLGWKLQNPFPRGKHTIEERALYRV